MQEFAKVPAVNPADFWCDKSSPINPAIWSNTEPQVALTHIFCGQIQRGKAEGYHSRPNNKDPVCARANNKIQEYRTYPLTCYGKIEVRQFINGLRDRWIARESGTYCFFPSQWNIVQTIKVLVKIYEWCRRQRDTDKICYKNFKSTLFPEILGTSLHHDEGSFGIVIFIARVNQQDVINSAFPVPTTMTMPCKTFCTG